MELSCSDFRRAVALDPRRLEDSALRHAEQCALCRRFLARELELASGLEDALRVPVPDGFEERMAPRGAPFRRISRRHALAAACLFALGAGATWLWRRNDALALAAIEFAVRERPEMPAHDEPADTAGWRRAAMLSGVTPTEQLGELRYFGMSWFDGEPVSHAVVKNCYGEVTILLIPGTSRAARTSAATGEMKAVIAPARNGNLAIVATSSQAIACAERNLHVG